MDIQHIQAFNMPNVFSLKQPIIKMRVKLGEYAEVPTKDIKGLNGSILQLFPGVKDHRCSTGYVGGFVDRLNEGTYLAHVTEHLCLELQRILGYDLKFGKARQVENDIYNVIFECVHPEIGKECGRYIIDTLNLLIQGQKIDLEQPLKNLRYLCTKHDLGPSTSAIVEEARSRNIPVSLIGDGDVVRLGYGKYQKLISATLYEGTSCIAVDICCDKSLTKAVLRDVFIPVPKGSTFSTIDKALKYADEIGYPIVLKPKNGNKGKYVFIGINNDQELRCAFAHAKIFDNEVIIEQVIKGRDYRILVVDGKFTAAAERIPAHVVGDGFHSVKQLIQIANSDNRRGDDHEKSLTKIKADDETQRVLRKEGIDLDYIPEKKRVIILRETANLSTGGEAYDCTDKVHSRNREIAELAVKAIGLDIAGIDIVIPDISKPMTEGYGAIVEVNAAPGIRMHLYPTKGKKQNVSAPILDMMYPKGTQHSIPIIAITGTNGKTTTTRMISRIMMEKGLTVGTTTTHGIYINDKCVEDGDTTGPNSAKRILYDRSVEAAVLETARGGIVREGLAYNKADVAVFTNLTDDHLEIDEIDTMEDLLKVKSLVIEAVKDDGTCVLNADDPWVMKVKNRAKGNIILISLDSKNPYLVEHVNRGGSGIFVLNNDIYLHHKRNLKRIIGIEEIPATLQGALVHNIYNSMAAIGASFACGTSINIIRKVMKTFSCDSKVNPGRFNIFDLDDFKVVLDYGHNMDGYKVTIEGLKRLMPSRIIGVIGVPGDRRNDQIRKIGELSGAAFDRVIIKEDRELRGRKPQEVANILLDGVLKGGLGPENIELISDEEEAFKYALQNGKCGDIIVAFFEKMEPLVGCIECYKNSRSNKNIRELAFVQNL